MSALHPLCAQHPAAANVIAAAVHEAGALLGIEHVLFSQRYSIAESVLESLVIWQPRVAP